MASPFLLRGVVIEQATREQWVQHILRFFVLEINVAELQANVVELQASVAGLQASVVGLQASVVGLKDDMDLLQLEMQHDSSIFPDNTARKVEFTAGTPADTWSAWVEVEDDTPVTPITFSSKVIKETHITGFLLEDLSDKDKRYELEVAWGDDKNRFLAHRFLSGEVKKLPAIQFIRIRAETIPVGEKVYYRMRCEKAEATCEISLRYHYHPD